MWHMLEVSDRTVQILSCKTKMYLKAIPTTYVHAYMTIGA